MRIRLPSESKSRLRVPDPLNWSSILSWPHSPIIAYLLGLYFTQEEINQLPNKILFNQIKPELDELLSMILVDYSDDKLITLKQLDTMGKLTSPMPRFTKDHKRF